MMDYIYASGTTYVVPYLSPLIIALVTRASMCLSARPPFRIGMAWTVRRSPSIIGRRLPMADNAPLLFSPRLGGLFPANAAAQQAMQDITRKVRVEIKPTPGNIPRLALCFTTLSKAAPRSAAPTNTFKPLLPISFSNFGLEEQTLTTLNQHN